MSSTSIELSDSIGENKRHCEELSVMLTKRHDQSLTSNINVSQHVSAFKSLTEQTRISNQSQQLSATKDQMLNRPLEQRIMGELSSEKLLSDLKKVNDFQKLYQLQN